MSVLIWVFGAFDSQFLIPRIHLKDTILRLSMVTELAGLSDKGCIEPDFVLGKCESQKQIDWYDTQGIHRSQCQRVGASHNLCSNRSHGLGHTEFAQSV